MSSKAGLFPGGCSTASCASRMRPMATGRGATATLCRRAFSATPTALPSCRCGDAYDWRGSLRRGLSFAGLSIIGALAVAVIADGLEPLAVDIEWLGWRRRVDRTRVFLFI